MSRIPEPPPDFIWPQGWFPCPDGWERTGSVEDELQRELCKTHPLYHRSCRVVGRHSAHPDEYLFAVDLGDGPLAFVHLTWELESDPNWPYTVMYASYEEFRDAWEIRSP